MLNIGPLELMVIFLIALIVVGPRKLPDLGRTIGKGLQEFRKAQQEVRDSLDLTELKDMKREIDEAQRGVRDMLRFDTSEPTSPPKPAPEPTPGKDAAPTEQDTDGPVADTAAVAEPPANEPPGPARPTGSAESS